MKISNLFSTIKEKLSKLFKSGKKPVILMVLVIVVMVMIAFSVFSAKPKSDIAATESRPQTSFVEYAENLEGKLKSMILQLEQVKSASVMVIVDSTPKVEYLTEDEVTTMTSGDGKSTTTKTSKVVFEKDGSLTTAVVVTTIMPKVVGVMIVMNKIDASTKLGIINSISSVLNIEASRISILQES